MVLVSHSVLLAKGLAQLVTQVAGDGMWVEPAEGEATGGLGTDGAGILRAIQRADRGSGVLVFADMGSAILTVRALLTEHMVGDIQVVLADAPFVEGALAAAAAASRGADLGTMAKAAEKAWQGRKLSRAHEAHKVICR
jgi:dihydroxyacetone kinase DhaKLM complex PTS-EIIA-like component DhaM